MKIVQLGIDLAKSVFQLHGVDKTGKVVVNKSLRRSKMLTYFANLESCLIGMEACAGSHYWARELSLLGHEVKLMAPQFVKPYVKGNKTDANDAQAICEAVGRPSMRFVSIKSIEQQDILMLHRIRQKTVKERTAYVNAGAALHMQKALSQRYVICCSIGSVKSAFFGLDAAACVVAYRHVIVQVSVGI